MSEALPNFLRRIVVPIANPNNAPHMLELAEALLHPEEGKLIVLTVSVGQGEETHDLMETVEPLIDEMIERGISAEHIARTAGSVTRGILDGAREYGAEALMIGLHRPGRGQVKFGSVVENLINAAPCNVLIYRPAESPPFDRVVVPLDSSRESHFALKTGVLIAKGRGLPLAPLYIQRDYTYRAAHEEVVRDVLEMVPDERVSKDIITGREPAQTILRMVGKDDLLVLGFSQKSNVDLELGRDVSNALLNRAPGPVLLASEILGDRDTLRGAVRRRLQRLNLTLTQVERNELVWEARQNAMPSVDYASLILFSALLASLGLLLNSVAVIIGAMLVAPLLAPLGALSTGIVTGELQITLRSTLTLVQGFLLAVVISALIGLILPFDSPTEEMLVRGSPTLLDAGIAFASGLVAAFALARKEIPAALAGVAIAAALMPPICTIGLGIAFGQPELAFGATLLFITNISFVVAASNLMFLYVGMRPGRRQENQRVVVAWWFVLLSLIVGVTGGLIVLTQTASRLSIEVSRASEVIIETMPVTRVVDMQIDEQSDLITFETTLRTFSDITPLSIREAEQTLEAEFGKPVRMLIVEQRLLTSEQEAEVVESTEEVALPATSPAGDRATPPATDDAPAAENDEAP